MRNSATFVYRYNFVSFWEQSSLIYELFVITDYCEWMITFKIDNNGLIFNVINTFRNEITSVKTIHTNIVNTSEG